MGCETDRERRGGDVVGWRGKGGRQIERKTETGCSKIERERERERERE